MNNKSLIVRALAVATFGCAMPAVAFAATPASMQVLSKSAHGRATEVRIDGQSYPVCNAHLKDECINPRAAGLKWGNRPLAYWPGKPASSIDAS
jgi:hypothetical protein